MKLPFYSKGVMKTASGHLRYTSPSKLRNKYVHRARVEELIAETPYSIRLLLPWPYEVHHMDYNKENNDPSNYLLLSESFHSKLTVDRPREDRGRFGRKFVPKWNKNVPDWVTQREMDFNQEVPF